MKKFLLIALFALFLPLAALADQAAEITKEASFSIPNMVNGTRNRMLDRNSETAMQTGKSKEPLVNVTLEGTPCAAVYIDFGNNIMPFTVQVQEGKEWVDIAAWNQPYAQAYVEFAPQTAFRLRFETGGKATALFIREIYLFTEGEMTEIPHVWEPPCEKADLLLLVGHPDDELLWFGGLLPTYASELRKKVQVTFIHTGTRADRRNELLDALWHCGVKHYPNLPEEKWNPDMPAYVVRTIRQVKAPVVVTQDVNGEYGNENHKRMVAAVIEAVTGQCADPEIQPDSAAGFGVWQPKKLYVHLWPENESIFDWSQKLTTMKGKTGFQIAEAAFRRHMSQQNGRHQVLMSGKYDCRRLGLYFTLVGPDDTTKPDLLQHIE